VARVNGHAQQLDNLLTQMVDREAGQKKKKKTTKKKKKKKKTKKKKMCDKQSTEFLEPSCRMQPPKRPDPYSRRWVVGKGGSTGGSKKIPKRKKPVQSDQKPLILNRSKKEGFQE